MDFEEAREILDNLFLNYAEGEMSWLEALTDLWEEHPDALQAIVREWADEA